MVKERKPFGLVIVYVKMYRALCLLAVSLALACAAEDTNTVLDNNEQQVVLYNAKVVMYNSEVQVVQSANAENDEDLVDGYNPVAEGELEETEPQDKGEGADEVIEDDGAEGLEQQEEPAAEETKTRKKRSYSYGSRYRSGYGSYYGGSYRYAPGFFRKWYRGGYPHYGIGYRGSYYYNNGHRYPYQHGKHHYPYGWRGDSHKYYYYRGYRYHFNPYYFGNNHRYGYDQYGSYTSFGSFSGRFAGGLGGKAGGGLGGKFGGSY